MPKEVFFDAKEVNLVTLETNHVGAKTECGSKLQVILVLASKFTKCFGDFRRGAADGLINAG